MDIRSKKLRKVLSLAFAMGLLVCCVIPSMTLGKEITLTFVQMTGPRYGITAKAMAKKYMATHPNVNIEVLEFPWEQHMAKIALDASVGGTSYDLIWIDYMLLGGYVDGGYLLPLDEYISKNPEYWNGLKADIYPLVLDLYKYRDAYWAVAADANTHIAYFRKDVLDKAGVEIPSSYDELFRIAPKVHNPPDMYAVGFQAKGWNTIEPFETVFFTLGDTYWDKNFVPQLDSETAIRATEIVKKLYEYAPEDVLSWMYFDVADVMGSTGVFAMWPVGGWGENLLTNPDVSLLADKIEVTEVLELNGKRGCPQGGYGLGINSRISKIKQDECWKFIMYLTAKENMRDYVKYTGQPSRISALTDPVNLETTRHLKAVAGSLKFAKARPVIPEYSSVMEIVGLEVVKAITGEKSPEQAMMDANKAVYDVMKERGRIKR